MINDLRRALDEVPMAHQTTPPAEDRWSAAEVVEHLCRVERSMILMLAKRLVEARARGLGPERETSSVRSMLDVTVFLDRTHGRKTPDSAQPAARPSSRYIQQLLNSWMHGGCGKTQKKVLKEILNDFRRLCHYSFALSMFITEPMLMGSTHRPEAFA